MIVQNAWLTRTRGPFFRKAIITLLIIFLETYTVLFQITENIKDGYPRGNSGFHLFLNVFSNSLVIVVNIYNFYQEY